VSDLSTIDRSPDGQAFLDVEGAAVYLGLNDQTVRRFAREGRMPAFKMGREWRFRRTTLDSWIESRQNGGASSRVLVVDDEVAILRLAATMLKQAGFDAVTAASGAAALDLAVQSSPDVIMLDLKMPGMDGPETLRRLRERGDDTPVIILTGYPDSELMHRALQFSPLMVLAKPAESGQLVEAVKRALKTHAPA